jgi:4-hydroxythreonine-4-phosphate dehydrogenase
MGDPAGIGPEIIIQCLLDADVHKVCRPVVLGDPGVLSIYLQGRPNGALHEIARPSEASGKPGRIDLLAISSLASPSTSPAKPSIEGGKAMVDYIVRAVEMAMAGDLAAMVTGPISKDLMQRAGWSFEGHTQLIASLTHTQDYVMMLAGKRLRVSLVTIHCAYRDVLKHLDTKQIYKTITMTSKGLRYRFGCERPRLAVAALNPHAGEAGLFGSEETGIIGPAIEKAATEGICVEGPFPADTIFHRANRGEFDAVVCMYHDQGLIPLKLLHFSDAVNITLGLPIIRTSVDHGTAYDIAGKGIADSSSLEAAVRTAAEMVKHRERSELK